MKYGPIPEVCDVNGKPLSKLGSVIMPSLPGRFLELLELIVCETLADPEILRTVYCERLVESIRSRTRCVEITDESTVPIVRQPLRSQAKAPTPKAREHTESGKRESRVVEDSESTNISSHVQEWVTVTTKFCGLVVIRPDNRLYEQNRLTCTNLVATTEPDIQIRVLITDF